MADGDDRALDRGEVGSGRSGTAFEFPIRGNYPKTPMQRPLLLRAMLASCSLALPAASQQVTTDTTQIYVAYANGVDKTMVNETMADAKVEVDVTVQKPDGSTVDLHVESVIVANQTTRRQLAADITAKLKAKLQTLDLPQDLVDHCGAGVTVKRTPKGVGKNAGTPDKPIKSPPNATTNHGHLETTTTDKNGK